MFSVILPGRPCLTNMATISANQFAFSFPATPHFSHVVVFMLPGNTLPPDTAAGVYMQLPGEQQFKFLGAIGNEKQSAIFQVNIPTASSGNVDMMTDSTASAAASDVSLGISVEPAQNIQNQMMQLRAQSGISGSDGSTALVTTSRQQHQPSTKVLAQRIIKNAFNFLASFAGGAGGQEVVPLKSFQDWWIKFERRIENDPGFLERDQGD